MKDCLAAVIQAKNMTITRKGYTPYQLACGRHPMFPDRLDEGITANMALRDALGIEGEVGRAAEMRTMARAVFLRQDVQEKLRRALKRWPRGEERAFNPGEMIYFYSPQPKTARFRKDGGSWRGPAVVLICPYERISSKTFRELAWPMSSGLSTQHEISIQLGSWRC